MLSPSEEPPLPMATDGATGEAVESCIHRMPWIYGCTRCGVKPEVPPFHIPRRETVPRSPPVFSSPAFRGIPG